MSITIVDRVVVFDYGEVISKAPSLADRAAIVRLAQVSPTRFWASYWKHRDALDQGTVSVEEYWRRIEFDTGAAWTSARVYQLWLADYRSWLTVDAAVLDVLIDLKAGGTRLALLSNAGRDFASYYRNGFLGSLFEKVFVSGEIGATKPGATIFRAALTGLHIDASEMLFIDNRVENVLGARELGIPAHVFTTAEKLRTFMQSLDLSRVQSR